jgi:hypothetical protein
MNLVPQSNNLALGRHFSRSSAVNSSRKNKPRQECSFIIRSGLYPQMAVSDNFLLRSDISMTGDYTVCCMKNLG